MVLCAPPVHRNELRLPLAQEDHPARPVQARQAFADLPAAAADVEPGETYEYIL